MKISVNTIKGLNSQNKSLKEQINLTAEELSNKIGSQLGAVEELANIGKKYEDVIVARVVSCEPHPNADRLHVCLIDDGNAVKSVDRNEQGLVQVVCGAPNVREGLTVAWLPPGGTVPETADKEPFVLEARDLRGVVSNGMLASPKELALGDNHDGILEIDGEHTPGEAFADTFQLRDDIVIDIENKMFTHRPDCFGFLGVAREIAGINHVAYTSPDWYSLNPAVPDIDGSRLPLEVINELPELVPRFTAIVMSGIEVKTSPVWLQVELAKMGLRPINNIVDLTNFFMLETGQPLHAYDYDKVKALSRGDNVVLKVRFPEKNEKLNLLNGKDITPRSEAILIATDTKAIGLGGIMGGGETEVDSSTKNIILECANFDMYSTRRTSMEQGLFSDAATRFTKGQSPLQNRAVILKIVDEVKKVANGKVSSELIDNNHLDEKVMSRGSINPPVTVNTSFINARLGLSLSGDQINQLLTNVEFKVEAHGDDLTFSAPFWRTDIELPEDIVEEVGRLYGYDALPLALPPRDLTPANKNAMLEAKTAIRERLKNLGANEILTYSFVHGELLGKVGQDKSKAYEVGNALRPELQYYRLSLMPSLLEKVHPNIKAGYDSFGLFELAKVHSTDSLDEDGLPREDEFIGLVIAKADKLKDASSPYFQAKRYLSLLCDQIELEFKPLSDSAQSFPVAKPYEPNRTAMVYLKDSDTFLGLVGEFKTSVKRALKLPKFTAGFEVDTSVLAKTISEAKSYTAIPRFPKVAQDISLKVERDVAYQELFNVVLEALKKFKPDNTILQLGPKDIYQGEDKEHKHITLSLSIASYDRTLTDQEINTLLDKVAVEAREQLKAERL